MDYSDGKKIRQLEDDIITNTIWCYYKLDGSLPPSLEDAVKAYLVEVNAIYKEKSVNRQDQGTS